MQRIVGALVIVACGSAVRIAATEEYTTWKRGSRGGRGARQDSHVRKEDATNKAATKHLADKKYAERQAAYKK